MKRNSKKIGISAAGEAEWIASLLTGLSWMSVFRNSLLALVFIAIPVMGEEIITDDFSTSFKVTESGGSFDPGLSKAGTKWLVEHGKAASDGTPLPFESPAGQLVLDRTKGTKVRIDFGSVKNDTAAKVSFQLRQWDGSGPSTAYFVAMTIGCKELGAEYAIMISLSPAYFGTEGGFSGVGIRDSGGAHGGLADAQFPNGASGQAFHDVTIQFDPAEGVSVLLDDQLVASHKNTDGLPRVDYFTLSNEGNADGKNLSWLMDNFSVEATLTE